MLFAAAVVAQTVFSGLGDVPFPVPPGKLQSVITRAGDLPQKQRPRWVATFVPVLGPTDHPREVPGLEYSCDPK